MAIWGYRQPFIGCVTIWLLTTPMVDKYPVTFYREGKRLLDLIMAEFGLVECYVWRPYKKARTWLERLGFKAYPVHELNSISPFTRMIKESL